MSWSACCQARRKLKCARSSDRERHLPCGTARCVARHPDNEAAPDSHVHGLRSVGLSVAGLRAALSFRAYVLTIHRSDLTVIGHLSEQDWTQVKACVRIAFAI
jgi:hypothetical protein